MIIFKRRKICSTKVFRSNTVHCSENSTNSYNQFGDMWFQHGETCSMSIHFFWQCVFFTLQELPLKIQNVSQNINFTMLINISDSFYDEKSSVIKFLSICLKYYICLLFTVRICFKLITLKNAISRPEK